MATEASDQSLYLDDLAVGQEFRSRDHMIEAERIVSFAAEFDPQSFHLDANAAKDSVFKGLAASGWHTAAVTMRLVTESVPFSHGIIGAGGEVSWAAPTRPGDILHVESRIIAITPSRSKPNQAFVTLESRTLNQNGDLRQTLVAKLLAFRRDS